jgi:hypothetical protein
MCIWCSITHKTAAIERWPAAQPLFVLQFTPTSSSWLNLVERWFAEFTNKTLKRGAHRSVRAQRRHPRLDHDLQRAPTPFVWTKTAEQILESIARYCNRINDSGH